MKTYQGQEFSSYYDRSSGKTFSDLEFRRCHFVSCSISITRDPRRRSTVRNVTLTNCEQHGCALETAIVEEVLIDSFKTNGIFQTWGAVFKHVVLRGKIGRIMISQSVATGMAGNKEQKSFDDANAFYYSAVDWAIDIREAQFEEADLRGVPARLVVRDPETQFVLTRERALEGKWREADLSDSHLRTAIELFLKRGSQDEVFVAPKRHSKFRSVLDGLVRLRDIGVLE